MLEKRHKYGCKTIMCHYLEDKLLYTVIENDDYSYFIFSNMIVIYQNRHGTKPNIVIHELQ